MKSYILEFESDGTMIGMYRDDDGMYRVIEIVRGGEGDWREFLLGVLYEKAMATHVFNSAVQKITREWELS